MISLSRTLTFRQDSWGLTVGPHLFTETTSLKVVPRDATATSFLFTKTTRPKVGLWDTVMFLNPKVEILLRLTSSFARLQCSVSAASLEVDTYVTEFFWNKILVHTVFSVSPVYSLQLSRGCCWLGTKHSIGLATAWSVMSPLHRFLERQAPSSLPSTPPGNVSIIRGFNNPRVR